MRVENNVLYNIILIFVLYITFIYEEQKKKKELKKVKIASKKLNQTNWEYSSMKWK